MKNVSNLASFLPAVRIVLVLAIIAKLIGLVALYYLPASGLSKGIFDKENSYVNLKLEQAFNLMQDKEDIKKLEAEKKAEEALTVNEEVSETLYPLDALKLKGIYYSSSKKFITLQEGKEVLFLEVGEERKGYKLIKVERHQAIFTRSGKQYVLRLDSDDKEAKFTKEKVALKKVEPKDNGITAENAKQVMSSVPRDEIKSYQKDMSKIWRNIGLKEHKKDGKTDGFVVTFVKKGSVFQQLGLIKNDVLIEANGYKLTSYKDALTIYKKIDTIKSLKLTVLRNNEEKELEYDIY